jgi:hypothetical protein
MTEKSTKNPATALYMMTDISTGIRSRNAKQYVMKFGA